LAIGALGVVFGDIGTSPLYAFREAIRYWDRRTTATAVRQQAVGTAPQGVPPAAPVRPG